LNFLIVFLILLFIFACTFFILLKVFQNMLPIFHGWLVICPSRSSSEKRKIFFVSAFPFEMKNCKTLKQLYSYLEGSDLEWPSFIKKIEASKIFLLPLAEKSVTFSSFSFRRSGFCFARFQETVQADHFSQIRESFLNYPLPVCITTQQGEIIFANQAFGQWLGYSAAMLCQRNFEDLLNKEVKDSDLFYSLLDAQQNVVHGALLHTMVKEDWVGLFFMPSDMACYSHDLGILNLLPVDAALLTEQGGIKQSNGFLEKSLGLSKKGALTLTSWIHQEDRPLLMKALKKARKTHLKTLELPIRLSSGNAFDLYLRYIKSEEEGPGSFLALFFRQKAAPPLLEVSHPNNKEADLHRMQLLGQLASGIVHDFNNLLTGIMGFCDLLLQRHKPEESSFKDIDQIKQNSMRAAKLIQQLLAFSRSGAVIQEVLSAKECLEDLMPLIRRMIGPKILVALQEKGPQKLIHCDKGQIEQILLNLAINARDSMQDGGTLTFRIRSVLLKQKIPTVKANLSAGSYVVIDVVDMGTGIDPQNIALIFQPFFSTKDPEHGTGLGLSNVLQMMEQFQGGICVESEVGKGTTFSLYFPEYKDSAQNPSLPSHLAGRNKKPPSVPRDEVSIPIKILFVEDEDPIRLFASRALREKGHEVIEARDGTQAVRLMSKNPDIQLVITDVMMPGIDGPALAALVKENHPEVKILFVSGYPEDEVRRHLSQDFSGVYFLQKPFALSDLVNQIQTLFEMSKSTIHTPEI
jgi:two-component system, cell cycle sensor histidine kinase and response regulator CckA